MSSVLSSFRRFNWIMFVCMLALAAAGVVFIHSTGFVRPVESLRGLWRLHAATAAVGVGVYLVFAAVDYRKVVGWGAVPFYAISCVLLVAVLVFGEKIYGGRRWLWFFQPSEIAKLAVIMFVAHVFAAPGRAGFKWFLAASAAVGIPAALILVEPDLGTALTLVPAVLAMLLAARVWTRGIVAMLAAAVLAGGILLGAVHYAERQPDPEVRQKIYRYMPLREHQITRLKVFLFPGTDIHGAGYNLRQAEISIGSGSVWGKGLRRGDQKFLGYLPPSVSMNDFIFAVLAEESGFVGSVTMLALFMGILLPGLATAFRCRDDCGRLLAVGVSTLVFCHVYVNVAMSVGLVPITGLPLPFISAGRTFLVVLMAALGMVQSIGMHPEEI